MKFNVITLFPKMFEQSLSEGVVGQALRHRQIELQVANPRDFTVDKYHRVDDHPYGGGDSMVMQIDPILKAIESLGELRGPLIYLTPQGRLWNDQLAREFVQNHSEITLLCGRYAGVDQRLINSHIDEEISVGNYVLSGGEIAAMAIVDSMSRYIPGVLGNPRSVEAESLHNGLLEGPIYTRPASHQLGDVPNSLLSGHHAELEKLKRSLSLVCTFLRRQDLLPRSLEIETELKSAASYLLAMDEREISAFGLTKSELIAIDSSL